MEAPFNDVLVHQVVVAQLSNKRQGTSNTLRRKDASYSTAKLRNQKVEAELELEVDLPMF